MNFWLTVLTGISDPERVFGCHSSYVMMCVHIHWRPQDLTLADDLLMKTPLDLQKRFPGGDVVGVVTPLVGGVAQAFHDDQVVELRVQLGVQEVEGKDREEQVEVERERRVKEVRPWMTMEMTMTRLRS